MEIFLAYHWPPLVDYLVPAKQLEAHTILLGKEDSLNYCLYHIIKYKCLILRFDSAGPEPCGIHSYKIESLYHNAASCKFQLHFHN